MINDSIIVFCLLSLTGISVFMFVRSSRQKHKILNENSRLQKALTHHQNSEKRFRRLVETAPDWIWEVDVNGLYTYASSGVEELLGYTQDEIIGTSPFDLMPPEEANKIGDIFAEIVADQRSFAYLENINIRKDGRMVVLETSGTPIFGADNELLGYHGVDRDVTNRKLAEDTMREEGEFINAVLEVAGNLIVVLDRAGRFVRFNRAAEELTGYHRDEVLGRKVWEMVIPEEQQAAVKAVFDNLCQGKVSIASHYENHWVTRKGAKRLLEWNNTVLSNEKGEVSHIITLGYDITDQRATEVEQERLQRELQQAHKMEALGQLSGGVAHDFNNLLGIIMGFSGLALERSDDLEREKLVEYLENIQNAGSKATDLVTQMLTFSRSEQTVDEELLIASLLDDDISMLRSTLPASIDIVTHIDEGLPAILMNPTELHQLLMNLSVNARDAMQGQGILTISLAWAKKLDAECSACHKPLQGDWIEISVTDTGSGIEPEALKQIFDPFFTTKEIGKGTGMGLSVVFGIVHNHGGHIIVESQPGEGTTFRLFFTPFMSEMDTTPEVEPPMILSHDNEGEEILIVDDETDLGEYLGDQLGFWGYQPTVLDDSQQALELFTQDPEKFALLITDQTMPGLTGTELITQCRKLRPEIPIILCSGYSDKIDQHDAGMLGISYLDKPIQSEFLSNTIQALLAGENATQ